MPPFMNASARDYNEAFFTFNLLKVLWIHRTEWDSRLFEKRRRIYPCLHECRKSYTKSLTALSVFSTTYCSLNMGNAYHFFQDSNNGLWVFFFFPHHSWLCRHWGLGSLSSSHTHVGHKVGRQALDWKGDNVLLHSWHGLQTLLYCGSLSIPDNPLRAGVLSLTCSTARESGQMARDEHQRGCVPSEASARHQAHLT